MKICFLAPGSSIHTIRWANSMCMRGHEVFILTMHRVQFNDLNPKIKVYYLKIPAPFGYYFNIFEARKIINKLNPDLVHTHYASGYGTLSRQVNFNNTLLSVWGSDVFVYPYKNKLSEKILRKNLLAAKQIASTSKIMKEQTQKFITSDNSIIHITPFGINLNMFKPSVKLEEADYIQIGMIKALENVYGPRYLIEGVAILIRKLRDNNNHNLASKVRLVIVGSGSLKKELLLLAKNLNILEITSFRGKIPHDKVPDILKDIDVFCAPSLSESFGVAVLEASACGIPVVASNVGGIPEVVIDGETGYLVEPKNSIAIAEKLFELVLDPDKRSFFGKRARKFVELNYDWEKNVDQVETIYKNLV